MTHVPFLRDALLAALCATLSATPSTAQVIDFETLPGGGATVDQQTISNEYAIYGVTFTLLDRVTGLPIGFPRIARAGSPQTAFQGCSDADTPRPGLGLGSSFLTDGTSLGVDGDVRMEYAVPVAAASGVIIDIDCRVAGGPPCEQWTITAYDTAGALLATAVLNGPPGAENPGCLEPAAGPGDAMPFGWAFDVGSPRIKSILLRYTGAATDVGLAFDNFSVSALPGPPSVVALASADTICAGETVTLQATVVGGMPPYSYRWQAESSPATWGDLGTASTQSVHPGATRHYRVIVTDALAHVTASAPIEVAVAVGGPLCSTSLLVSSFNNNRVVRYSFQSGSPDVLVLSGLGGLSGPSKLVCGGDQRLYVVSQLDDAVRRYDGTTGAFVDVFVPSGSGGLDVPVGIAFGPDGNLYVASNATNTVLRYDGVTGTFIDAFVPASGGLNGPTGIVFGPDDQLYVSCRDADKVRRFDGGTGAPLGDFVTSGSGGLDAPRGLAFGPDGHLYVAEEVHDSVRRYDGSTGAFIDVFVPPGSGGLDRANDLAFGPDGALYVASFNNDVVLRYEGTTGAFLNALPDGVLDGPAWLAVGCTWPTVGVPAEPGPLAGPAVGRSAPNPFRDLTSIEFVLRLPGPVKVSVVDVAGRVVATLLDRELPRGPHTVHWNGRRADGHAAQPGVYFLRVQGGGVAKGPKMVLVR